MHDKLPDRPKILSRKEEHLSLALEDEKRRQGLRTGFGAFDFVHCALPEARLGDEELATVFLGRKLKAPFMIGSMTGGPRQAATINSHLAEAAAELGIAMGVGSQRVALENAGDSGIDVNLRKIAPEIMLIGNIGGAQLVGHTGVDLAKRAIGAISADAIFVHLNPLQEALQPGGDTDWRGVLGAIERLCKSVSVPVIVKEIGCGISADVARQLAGVGVAAIDVAGAGGTSWAWIESQRQNAVEARFYADTFADWGLPAADAIREVCLACPDLPLIGSGGVRNGVDAAKAFYLGADLVSIAGGILPAALNSTDAVVSYFEKVIRQLRITCFVTGSKTHQDLRQARTFRRASV